MSKNNNNIAALDKFIKYTALGCLFFFIAYIIWGIQESPDWKFFSESAQIYDGEWVRDAGESSDGIAHAYKMPMSLKLKKGEKATFRTVLPGDVEKGMYLSIHTGKSFSMYIDNKEIYSISNRVSKLPGNITKALIVPVPLEDEYAGRELTVVFSDDKYERSTVNTAYIGSLMGIVVLYLRNYALQFIMANLLILTSLVTIIVFTYIGKRDKKRADLIYLAEAVILICLWVLFDTPLFQIVFGVYFFDGIASFMLVTAMVLPFCSYFDAITDKRNHRIFNICKMIMLLNFIVLTALHLMGIRSYDKSLVYVDAMLAVYIVILLAVSVRDYVTRKDRNHRKVIIGLLGLGLFGVLEIIVTIITAYLPFKVDIGGLAVLLGIVFFFIFAVIDQIGVYEKLKLETQNALAATQAKSDFLANMSHEIRTPINAIMGMNEMVLRECRQEDIIEYARDISNASENLLKIVNDILDFSKIESGKIEIICDNYDLGELICDVTALVKMKAEDKGLQLKICVDEEMPCMLYGDDKRVREIMTNIINNAIKYTDKGFVNIGITGKTQNNIETLTIVVEDSGQGIKPEDIDSIFEGFSQVNVKQNKNIEGTGLGLSITKRLVEIMNGKISVNSHYGEGTTFTVELPQTIISTQKMGKYFEHRRTSGSESGAQFLNSEFPGVKILVVDDTALNLKVVRNFLSKTKAEVTCVLSGEEMLELVTKNKYNIIFLDHMMPNMDGIETLKRFKALENNLCKTTPVIALTANAIVGAREMYLEAGFDDYLSKPIRMGDLCEMIRSMYEPGL